MIMGLNLILAATLVLAGVGFLGFGNAYGVFLALVSFVIGAGVFYRRRWAYFASAAWGLAGYQLAKEGLEFETLKRTAMVLGVTVIVISIFLHEKLGRKPPEANNNGGDGGDI